MSNVSDVTPYDEEATGNSPNDVGVHVGAAVGALAVGCASVVCWLIQDSETDKAALSKWKSQHAQTVLDEWKNLPPQSLKTANLHMDRPDTLVRTAVGLGYRTENLSLSAGTGNAVLLHGPQGQRLAIAPNDRGRMTLMSAGGSPEPGELLRQHSLDRALEHLARQGMQVQTVRLATGEVQILAREMTPKAGGTAEIKAQIRSDGTAWVDVDQIRGRRCEEIVQGLADAVGGKVSKTQKKEAYFQLPGEPAKTRIRV